MQSGNLKNSIQLLVGLALLTLTLTSVANVEYKKFTDPQQEQTYQTLVHELRCLVCQNQTIADSNADLAKDLRRQVYEMLGQGKSRDEIVAFMVARYGDFVMYNPLFKAKTSILWLAPVVFLLFGMVIVWVLVIHNRQKTTLTNQPHATDTSEVYAEAKVLLDKGK